MVSRSGEIDVRNSFCSSPLNSCVFFQISHARSKSVSRIVDQIEYFFCNIELFHSPSFVTLCNMSVDGEIRQEFQRRFHQNRAMTCFEMTEKSYLDLFDRKKLIYLSPNSPFEMTEFDHNAVYVIGAIIDSSRFDLKKKIRLFLFLGFSWTRFVVGQSKTRQH